jgi:hypothetical protein
MLAAIVAPKFAERRHHPALAGALVVLFWIVAAALVFAVRIEIAPRSATASAVSILAVLLIVAWAYTALVARCAGGGHALGVGITWLFLTVVTEMVMTSHFGRGWFALLGPPDRPFFRNLILFAWIFSPALFAHSCSAEGES